MKLIESNGYQIALIEVPEGVRTAHVEEWINNQTLVLHNEFGPEPDYWQEGPGRD